MLPFRSSILAQSRVTGHVFAEVVESMSVTYNVNNWVVIPPNSNEHGFDLGEISVNGGSLTAYDLIIISSGISGKTGMRAPFDTTTDYNNLSYILDSQGKQVFQLYGSTNDELFAAKEKSFVAEYNIIFAYN